MVHSPSPGGCALAASKGTAIKVFSRTKRMLPAIRELGGFALLSPFPTSESVPEVQAPARSEFSRDKHSFKSGGPEVIPLMK
jgi:hypothetical protein